MTRPSLHVAAPVALLLGIATASAADRPWHLMTTTVDGHVSLSSSAEGKPLDLTERQCRFMAARAQGLPATPEEQKAADENYQRKIWRESQILSGRDIATAECFQ